MEVQVFIVRELIQIRITYILVSVLGDIQILIIRVTGRILLCRLNEIDYILLTNCRKFVYDNCLK